MKTYTLVFTGDESLSPLKIEIDVAEPASLFEVAERHVTGKRAQLWDGSNLVGVVTRSQAGFWSLTAADRVERTELSHHGDWRRRLTVMMPDRVGRHDPSQADQSSQEPERQDIVDRPRHIRAPDLSAT